MRRLRWLLLASAFTVSCGSGSDKSDLATEARPSRADVPAIPGGPMGPDAPMAPDGPTDPVPVLSTDASVALDIPIAVEAKAVDLASRLDVSAVDVSLDGRSVVDAPLREMVGCKS